MTFVKKFDMVRAMQATVSQLIDAIGQETFLSELNVTERALRHARHTNSFAAGWYLPVKTVAERHGVHCPDNLFNWKPLLRDGDSTPSVQDNVTERAGG